MRKCTVGSKMGKNFENCRSNRKGLSYLGSGWSPRTENHKSQWPILRYRNIAEVFQFPCHVA